MRITGRRRVSVCACVCVCVCVQGKGVVHDGSHESLSEGLAGNMGAK